MPISRDHGRATPLLNSQRSTIVTNSPATPLSSVDERSPQRRKRTIMARYVFDDELKPGARWKRRTPRRCWRPRAERRHREVGRRLSCRWLCPTVQHNVDQRDRIAGLHCRISDQSRKRFRIAPFQRQLAEQLAADPERRCIMIEHNLADKDAGSTHWSADRPSRRRRLLDHCRCISRSAGRESTAFKVDVEISVNFGGEAAEHDLAAAQMLQ